MNYRLLLVALALHFGIATASAEGTAFTYQGSLTDQGSPATGLYDLRFTVFDALADGNSVGTAVEVNDLSVSNGLFTATIDPGANVFTGPPRWLNIGVRPGASTGVYTDVAPRQALTAAPYAIKAGSVTGPIPTSQLAGTITAGQLANGAASANLAASGLAGVGIGESGVASGGMVLSLSNDNTALLNAGYVKLLGNLQGGDIWAARTSGTPPPAARFLHSAVWTGSEMIVWGGFNSTGNIDINYNDTWSLTPGKAMFLYQKP